MNKFLIFIIAVAVSFSCSTKQTEHEGHADEHGHGHGEEPKITLTAYSDKMEVFAEARPFVIGEENEILSHLTWLNNFKPLTEGEVTLSLTVGGKTINQKLTQPLRKGIYKFTLKPEVAGKGKLVFEVKSPIGENSIELNDVTVFAKESDADEYAEQMEPSKTNAITFTKEQSWKCDFRTTLPAFDPFGQVIKAIAQVKSAQGDISMVVAQSSGVVIFSSETIIEGMQVNSGKALFTISSGKMADNNTAVKYAELQNRFNQAKSEYERHVELAKDKIISDEELQSSKTDYENAKVSFETYSKNFSPAGEAVCSPMSGYVKQLLVTNGQYVETGQSLLTITKNQSLILQANVQSKYSSVLGSIINANIKNMTDEKVYSLDELNGKILSYGKSTNGDNYLIPVSLQVNNVGSLVAGCFVELYLKTQGNTPSVSVPTNSLIEEQGNFFVFVQINPELFEKREVKIGQSDGISTEIIHGLNKQERVVSEGAVLVKLSQASGALDPHSGHTH